MSDLEIAKLFFDMLKRNGVRIEETDDNGPGFKIIDKIQGDETIEVCFFDDGSYWRIMGYTERGYSDEIHKDGWK